MLVFIFYFINQIVAMETIEGGKLFKGGNYSRKYSIISWDECVISYLFALDENLALGFAVPGIAIPCLAVPGLAVPRLAGPGLAGPGLAAPGIAGSGFAVPGIATPCLAVPGLAVPRPGLVGPGLAGPGIAGSGLAGPRLAVLGHAGHSLGLTWAWSCSLPY